MMSPRRLQGLFLAVALLFAGAVGWLGWTLLEQDRALARERRREQLEAAAERAAGALYRKLGELEEAATGGRLPAGVVRFRVRDGIPEVEPSGALVYFPVSPTEEPLPAELFAASEEREFRGGDPAGAAAALRPLAASPNPRVRAEALLRLGRNLRKAGENEDALRVYAALAEIQDASAGGIPAGLAAHEGRAALLEQLGRQEEVLQEGRDLLAKLMGGRWRLRRAAWESLREQAVRWAGSNVEPDQGKTALASAAEAAWAVWMKDPSGRGQRIFVPDEPVVTVWGGSGGIFHAAIAPAEILRDAMREAQPFSATLIDSGGNRLLGAREEKPRIRVERTPASTRLPWTLSVASRGDGSEELGGRTWMVGLGFALLVALLTGVSFVVARAVAKEVAVARLQADFVAAVSHEFRSPLSSISQIAELLMEDRWPTSDHRRKGCEILGRESARLRGLVEGLLDFARMEAGTATYNREPLETADFLKSVVSEFRDRTADAQVDARWNTELPLIRADREALRRALWNLLDNGVRYSAGPAHIQVAADECEGRLTIRVKDRGIGIPLEEQERVFEKFYRGADAKERKVKGTGIGLAMVRHIVEGHGGEVHLESTPGEGSTFTIALPAERRT